MKCGLTPICGPWPQSSRLSRKVLKHTITVTGIAKVNEPRGALWAGRAASALWRLLARTPHEPSAAEAAAREAAAVRAMARHHMATDPGFAADLLAAADRHEARSGR